MQSSGIRLIEAGTLIFGFAQISSAGERDPCSIFPRRGLPPQPRKPAPVELLRDAGSRIRGEDFPRRFRKSGARDKSVQCVFSHMGLLKFSPALPGRMSGADLRTVYRGHSVVASGILSGGSGQPAGQVRASKMQPSRPLAGALRASKPGALKASSVRIARSR